MKALTNLISEFDKLNVIDGIQCIWYVHAPQEDDRYIKLTVVYTVTLIQDIREIYKDIRDIIGYAYDIEYNPLDNSFKITK